MVEATVSERPSQTREAAKATPIAAPPGSTDMPSIALPQSVQADLAKGSAAALQALGPEAMSARGSSPRARAERFRGFASEETLGLAERVAHDLHNDFGALKVRGFPNSGDGNQTTMALLIFCAGLGVPMPNNRDGVLAWPVVAEQPVSSKDTAGNTRDGNTGSHLLFHTDPCSFAALFCELPALTGGSNLFVSVKTVHDRIAEQRPDLLEELYKPVFIDRKGEEQVGASPYATIPVFAVQDGNLQCHWTRTYTVSAYKRYDVPPLSPLHDQALRYLEKTINTVAAEIEFTSLAEKGDLVLMNNNKVFHSRGPFSGDRRLMRVWIESSKYPSLPHTFGYQSESVRWPE